MNSNFIFIGTYLLFASIFVSGQQYHRFPVHQDKPFWCIQQTTTDRSEFEEEQTIRFFYYTMIGDTVIGENTYQKVYQLSDTIADMKNVESYVCGIRESTDSCIYRINRNDTTEYKLFDYSLDVSDTVNLDTDAGKMLYQLSAKNMIFLQGENYTEYLGSFDKWIDGIGSTSKGIDWYELPKPAMTDYSYNLRTFKKDDTLVFGEYFSTYLKSDITAKFNFPIDKELNVYPNPLIKNNEITIDSRNLIQRITVYNNSGNVVKSVTGIDIKSITLDTKRLGTGVYFLRIVDELEIQKTVKVLVE